MSEWFLPSAAIPGVLYEADYGHRVIPARYLCRENGWVTERGDYIGNEHPDSGRPLRIRVKEDGK